MKKLTSCLLFIFLLTSCSDENEIPDKNTKDIILNQVDIEKLEESLLSQIKNDNILEIHLSKKQIIENGKDGIINVDFILEHGESIQDSLPITYQDNEWNIQCSLPICQFSASLTSVTKQFISAIEDKNMTQMLSIFYVPDPYLKKRLQQQLGSTLPKLNQQFIKHGGVSGINFSTISVSKANDKAIVPFKLNYQDNQTDKFKYSAIKREDKWYIRCEFEVCKIYDKPESVVKELIYAIINADPERFVNLLDVAPIQKTKLLEYYKIKLPDLKSKISEKDGVENIVIDSVSTLPEEPNKSQVLATIFYNDGTKEQQTYITHYIKNRWFVEL